MPAEILVRLVDGPGGRERGQIISMKELPHDGWGKAECPPTFGIVKVGDQTYKQLEKYHVRHYAEHEDQVGDEPPEEKFRVRSKYKLDIDKLATAIKDDIPKPGSTEVNIADIQSNLKDQAKIKQAEIAARALGPQ